jgi:acyl-coenzyme A synthetase/AMP-(fatty) acid ligase
MNASLHGSGLYCLPNVAKAAANVILASKSFEPKIVFETIQRRRVTNIFMAPAMIKRLILSPEIDRYDLGSLRCINYGGGPILVEDLKAAVKKMGQVFVQLFGQAEAPKKGLLGTPNKQSSREPRFHLRNRHQHLGLNGLNGNFISLDVKTEAISMGNILLDWPRS